MTAVKHDPATELSLKVIQAFDNVNGGVHTGFRPAHAKGILLTGVFTPAPTATTLTRAPHAGNGSTPVTARFSDFAGIPTIPDNHPDASPRGFALRFQLGEHVHTDIVAHSVDGFPARTAEEFVEFLNAVHASGPEAAKPSPIETFLGAHPAALAFVMQPKPAPVSFARENYFAVNAYKFTNPEGAVKFGRYRIVPENGAEHLDAAAAAAKPNDFLFDEIKDRLTKGTVKLLIRVQLAEPGDVVDDSTIHWPEERAIVDFGTVELTAVAASNDAEQRHIIFDPIPRVDGIEPSSDPLLEPRADAYLVSGRRRRAEGGR